GVSENDRAEEFGGYGLQDGLLAGMMLASVQESAAGCQCHATKCRVSSVKRQGLRRNPQAEPQRAVPGGDAVLDLCFTTAPQLTFASRAGAAYETLVF